VISGYPRSSEPWSLSLARFLSKCFEEFSESFWLKDPLGDIDIPVQLVGDFDLDLLAPPSREAPRQNLEPGLSGPERLALLVAGLDDLAGHRLVRLLRARDRAAEILVGPYPLEIATLAHPTPASSNQRPIAGFDQLENPLPVAGSLHCWSACFAVRHLDPLARFLLLLPGAVDPLTLPPPSDWTDHSRWSPLSGCRLSVVPGGEGDSDSASASPNRGRLEPRGARTCVVVSPPSR
jgi:hypothetical protein